jgi:hypothetical protein
MIGGTLIPATVLSDPCPNAHAPKMAASELARNRFPDREFNFE